MHLRSAHDAYVELDSGSEGCAAVAAPWRTGPQWISISPQSHRSIRRSRKQRTLASKLHIGSDSQISPGALCAPPPVSTAPCFTEHVAAVNLGWLLRKVLARVIERCASRWRTPTCATLVDSLLHCSGTQHARNNPTELCNLCNSASLADAEEAHCHFPQAWPSSRDQELCCCAE
jgi:hypothetical protein